MSKPVSPRGGQSQCMDIVIVTASYDHVIKFWLPSNLNSGVPYREIQHPDSQINCLVISPDPSHRFLACGGYQYVQLYEFNNSSSAASQRVIKFNGFSKNITQIGFRDDGTCMYTVGEDGYVRVWEVREDTQTPLMSHKLDCPINCCVLHPNQAELIIGDQNGVISVLDLDTNQITDQWSPVGNLVKDHFVSIQSIALDPDATMLAALTNKGTCHVWSVSSIVSRRQPDPALTSSGDSCTTAAVGPTMQHLSRFNSRADFQAHETYGLKCMFSYDSTMLVTCSADKTARLWTTTDFQLAYSLEEPGSQLWVWDCAFTRDSSHLLTVSSDGHIRYWNVANGKMHSKWSSGVKIITCLAFLDATL